jgi:hypothetical protein
MTGFLDVGVANPLSRVTAASLADLGYSVNIAAADPYTAPLVSPIVQESDGGRQFRPGSRAGGSGQWTDDASLPHLFNKGAAAAAELPELERLIGFQVSSNSTATSARPARRPALEASATRFDAEIADAAVTATYQRDDSELWDDDDLTFAESDDVEFGLAWESFEPTAEAFARLAAM